MEALLEQIRHDLGELRRESRETRDLALLAKESSQHNSEALKQLREESVKQVAVLEERMRAEKSAHDLKHRDVDDKLTKFEERLGLQENLTERLKGAMWVAGGVWCVILLIAQHYWP